MIGALRHALADWRTGRELRSSTSDLANPAPWLLAAFGLGLSKSGATVSADAAFNVSAIRKCVDFRAMLIASLPIKVYRKTARGPVEQGEHPLSSLFRGRVSPARTRYKWAHVCSVAEDLGGNAYSRIVRDAYEQPVSIVWTRSPDIRPLYNETTDAVAFDYKGQRLQQDAVLHFASLSTNGVTGRSPIADLRESIGLALTAEEFAARTFANGNRKPGVLEGAPNMTQAKAEEFVRFWMQHHAGAANAGKTPLVFGGVQWKDAGFSNHDAELLLTRRFSIEEIARVYHIPLLLVGDSQSASAWGSAVEKITRGVVDFMLAPRCTNWEAEINTTLLTEREQEEGYYVKFVVDAMLRGSLEQRAKIYQLMRSIAAMDVNQIRDLEEWPLYPDAWAGDPRLPMNNQGGGGAQQEREPAPTGESNE